MAIRPQPTRLTFAQRNQLQRFGVDRAVDLHCHVLPGVDDGPSSMTDALALCRQFVRDGFTDVVATPHQLGRWDGSNLPSQIRNAVIELQTALDSHQVPLNVYAGGEVRIDERLGKLLSTDGICTLTDAKKYLLLELPPTGQIEPAAVMRQLEGTELRIILAHAERYETLMADHNIAGNWLDAGAALQINAGSLLGAFGKPSMDAAWDWLSSGWISVVATDSHSTGSRRPRMSEAIDMIVREVGADVAKTVCFENPQKILFGEAIDLL